MKVRQERALQMVNANAEQGEEVVCIGQTVGKGALTMLALTLL